MEAALVHRLPKPLSYIRALARFAFLATLVMMFTPLQLPSVNHNPSFSKIVNRSSDHTSSESVANNYHQETGNPSCDGCARDTEENTI